MICGNLHTLLPRMLRVEVDLTFIGMDLRAGTMFKGRFLSLTMQFRKEFRAY